MKQQVLIVLILVILAGLLGWVSIKRVNQGLTTPLPVYLDKTKTFGVYSLNLWLPNIGNIISSFIDKPQITAKSALVYDLTHEKLLYSKNPSVRLPIASLVKIMTAVVTLENTELIEVYRVSEQAASIGENSMGLTSGEQLTAEELLYGLLLVSGNDAAEVLAENFVGGRTNFVSAMNDKAKTLGLTDTFFINPSGLAEESEEYSTAHDLLVLTKYAMNITKFAEIAGTYERVIPYSQYHKAFYLYNDTNLLTTYPGVKGVKPGYTPEAGLCLVTYAENGGHQLIGIILGSESRREEMRELLDYSFKTLGVKIPGRN